MTKKKPTKTKAVSQLTALRKAVGLSLDDVAIEIGSERSTIYYWETGQREPLPKFRPGYARCLSITVPELWSRISTPRSHARVPNGSQSLMPSPAAV